ncbi:MAG TPA: UDP-N-acetylmuramate dehydrogenase [Solirubrobacteraceae bacterium]|jgi:UDP-N-acetylmuramate dehydrogenase
MTDEPPAGVRRDVPLERFSTIRTGGRAEYFARASDPQALLGLLRWAGGVKAPVAVIGSGSNLLIADDGVDGLVLKLDGQLAAIELDGERLICGTGARLPAVAARSAREGLSGIEFGVNIPGTVGGAVRMNANAYGGQLSAVLEWVNIATAAGIERRAVGELHLGYRSSGLEDGEILTQASFLLSRSDPDSVKATLSTMRSARHEAQPQGIKTFGSTFKNPDDPNAQGRTAGLLLSQAGCNGLAVGGARFAPKHANFIENTGSASTAEVLALMAQGRSRVLERFGVALEPEVQTLGPVTFPW